MSDFPEQIKQAAITFKNESIAYAQVRLENNVIKLRLQALEVARQFQGDVTYGRDPKGVLFYNDQLAFEIPNADFTYQRLGSGALVTIVINFTPTGETKSYARFVARVLATQLPHLGTGRGTGSWKDFKAGSAQTRAISIGDSPRLNLLFAAIRRTVHFNLNDSGRVDIFGIFLFLDEEKLKPGKSKVTVNPDIIFFYETGTDKVIGQFVPAGPIKTGSSSPIQGVATWEIFDPSNSSAQAALGLKVEEEADQADQVA